MRGSKTRTAGSPSSRLHWAVAFLTLALAYFAVFSLIRDEPLARDLTSVARNMLSLAISAWGTRAVLKRWLLPLKGLPFWLSHAALALGFTFLWLWLLTLATAMFEAGSPIRFAVAPFLVGPSEGWQLLQGLFAYGALAAVTILEHRPAGSLIVIDSNSPELRERFLYRAGDEVLSLAAADIVSIKGADDYSELVTASGNELVSTTLAQFEAALDPARFLRVHRSAIANLDHVERAEPAGGGRMILRMSSGPDLPVSRAGAKLLRERLL